MRLKSGVTVMTNNYYVDEYSRLVNRISLDEERLNRLVEQVSDKAAKNNNENFKQIAIVAAVAVAITVGFKFVKGNIKMR